MDTTRLSPTTLNRKMKNDFMLESIRLRFLSDTLLHHRSNLSYINKMGKKFNKHQFGSARETDYFCKYASFFDTSNNILDLGCGTGLFMDLMVSRNKKVCGVDIDPVHIQICKQKNLQVIMNDALHFLNGTKDEFDGIMCSHIIEHYDGTEGIDLISRCYDVLKPGGILVLITPNPSNLRVITELFWLDITHKRPYPLSLLVKSMNDIGFDIVESHKEKLEKWYDFYRIFWDKFRNFFLNGSFYGEGDIVVVGKK